MRKNIGLMVKNLTSISVVVLFIVFSVCIFKLVKLEERVDTFTEVIDKVERTLSTATEDTDSNSKEQISTMPAPEFVLQDYQGKNVSLNDLSKEKRKLLVFAKKGCSYCDDYYPVLNQFAKNYSSSFEVVVVKLYSDIEEIKAVKEKEQYSFFLLNGNEEVFQDYQIQGTPTTFLLTENNEILEAAAISTEEDLIEWLFAI